MGEEYQMIHTYLCPKCSTVNERDTRNYVRLICGGCNENFSAEQNWKSTKSIKKKRGGKMIFNGHQPANGDLCYWIGGIQLTKKMSFEVKIEKIAARFTPVAIEHGKGYAVLEYDFAHKASQMASQLREYNGPYEDWLISTNGTRIAVVDNNYQSDTNDDTEIEIKDVVLKDGDSIEIKITEKETKNESYAG
jgi:hypothetical protein